MAALVWDQVGEKKFETGISNGVLYPDNGPGVAWNGLISVEDTAGDQLEPIFFDGLKINDVMTPGDFSGVLKAYTYPDEFMQYEGVQEYQEGIFVTHQPRGQFGLSFKTIIGDDIQGVHAGYKLHLLYNLTAVAQQRSYETLSLDVTPIEFEWAISAVPIDLEFFRPTAHVIIDSTQVDPFLLSDIEDILYGSEDNDPHLPGMIALGAFIRSWERLVITDHGDGTWTASTPLEDVIVMTDATTFEITTDTATYLDADTYEITSSEKNEGDIWLP